MIAWESTRFIELAIRFENLADPVLMYGAKHDYNLKKLFFTLLLGHLPNFME